ncbi:DUF6402 family protein [Burkholderia arboris]|uniref:DUF6402 family protein n=1 Tax=Burkholderia arboris TaxID=488730 RepID=UPI0037093A1E
MKATDVCFPVYNADYRRWREKHHRGRDFMTYSKPVYLKLKKPIDIKLGETCRLEPSDTLAWPLLPISMQAWPFISTVPPTGDAISMIVQKHWMAA